jgi:hypothetical protein
MGLATSYNNIIKYTTLDIHTLSVNIKFICTFIVSVLTAKMFKNS